MGRRATAAAPPRSVVAADARAERFVAQLAAGEFDQAEQGFAPALRSAVDAATLRTTWQKVLAENGARVARAAVIDRPGTTQVVVYVRDRFERGLVSFKVVTDSTGAITGLWYLPLGPAAAAEPAAPDATPLAVARRLAALLRVGAFYAATGLFDERMRASLLPEQIAEVWRTLVAQVGPYLSTTLEETTDRDAPREVVLIERHERGEVELRIALGEGPHPVVGLRIGPHE